MTQEHANKLFDSELGWQFNILYVTSDDKPFTDYGEARFHATMALGNDKVDVFRRGISMDIANDSEYGEQTDDYGFALAD
jgi:hypothetical protein